MQQRHPRARIAIGIVLALLLALLGTAALALVQLNQQLLYPGATVVADDSLTRYSPNIVIRRTALFRSDDTFTKIYNWYSSGFKLGPESYAQSNCILMSRAWTTAWVIEQQMSVTLCATPHDQMIFVMRAIKLPLTSW